MSNQDNHTEQPNQAPSTLQPMFIIFGIVLVLATVLAMLIAAPAGQDAAPVVANVEENIKPVAVVEVAPVAVAHTEQSGADVVKGACVACHAAGMLNAPIIGNKAQWAPRIALGYNTLVDHAINGIRSMPARGGNADLTDKEIAAAVADMANQSGAKFDVASYKQK